MKRIILACLVLAVNCYSQETKILNHEVPLKYDYAKLCKEVELASDRLSEGKQYAAAVKGYWFAVDAVDIGVAHSSAENNRKRLMGKLSQALSMMLDDGAKTKEALSYYELAKNHPAAEGAEAWKVLHQKVRALAAGG